MGRGGISSSRLFCFSGRPSPKRPAIVLAMMSMAVRPRTRVMSPPISFCMASCRYSCTDTESVLNSWALWALWAFRFESLFFKQLQGLQQMYPAHMRRSRSTLREVRTVLNSPRPHQRKKPAVLKFREPSDNSLSDRQSPKTDKAGHAIAHLCLLLKLSLALLHFVLLPHLHLPDLHIQTTVSVFTRKAD